MNFLALLVIELLLLILSVSLLYIVLFIEAICSLFPNHLIIHLVLSQDVSLTLLVHDAPLTFHLSVFLLQHFVVKILLHPELYHELIAGIVGLSRLSCLALTSEVFRCLCRLRELGIGLKLLADSLCKNILD